MGKFTFKDWFGYSHLEMEAALCVWKCLDDRTSSAHRDINSALCELREAISTAELRHMSIAMGQYCLAEAVDDLALLLVEAKHPVFYKDLEPHAGRAGGKLRRRPVLRCR